MERFWSRVVKGEGDACHLWTGAACVNRAGALYGRFSYEGRTQLAHRVVLQLAGVVIPSGCHVHHAHTCVSTLCVREDHLTILTPKDHSDAHPERARGVVNAAKTECPHGHPYSVDNTIHYRGKRFCRACKAASRRA